MGLTGALHTADEHVPPHRVIEPLPKPKLVDVRPYLDIKPPPCSFSDRGYRVIELPEVVKETLAQQRGIMIADEDVWIAIGRARESAAPFDTLFDASAERTDSFNLQNTDLALKTCLFGWSNSVDAVLNKKTRAGTQAVLTMEVDQQKNDLLGPPPFNRNNVAMLTFEIIQPLLRDFLYGEQAMNERALWLLAQAARLDALQVTADSVLESIEAYWDTVAAKGSMYVLQKSIDRLVPLVIGLQKLSEEGEVAPNDVNQPLAQLAHERARLATAEQAYYAALRLLKLRMGSDVNIGPDCCKLCEDNLTSIDRFLVKEVDPCQFRCVQRMLVEFAWQYRFDLAAAAARERAAIVALDGARNAVLPALNLFGGVQLTDSFVGERSRPLFAGMRFSRPQSNINFGVAFSYPLENSAACGKLIQRKAEFQRAKLVSEQLQQDISADVLTRWNDYIQLLMRLRTTDQAIVKYQALFDNESTRLKAGFSTLFELIEFQNRLTDEQLIKVEILNSIAKTIAQIYSLTGTLITPGRCNSLEVADTTLFPTFLLRITQY